MSQIIKRFIGDNQVGAAKIELENNSALEALNSSNVSTSLLKLNASNVFELLLLPQYSGSNIATESYVGTQLGNYIPTSEKGANNGVATLDAGGKVPVAQLPNSVMEYKGAWNANTNTPTLANGTGNAGDVYIVSVAGSTDFGAGAIAFGVNDWVIYNGSIWQKSASSLTANQVNGTHIRLANDQYLRARNAADSADVNMFKVDTNDKINSGGDILPSSTNSYYLGGTGNMWARLYANEARDTSDFVSIDIAGRVLADSAGSTVLGWAGPAEIAIYANMVPSSNNAFDLGSTGNNFKDIYATYIKDGSGFQIIDLLSRELKDAAGVVALNFSNSAALLPKKPFLYDANGLIGTSASGQANLQIYTNDATLTALASGTDSGYIDVYTGDASGTANSGFVSIYSGMADTGNSGDVYLGSGDVNVAGNTGSVFIATGAPTGGTRGDINAAARFVNLSGDTAVVVKAVSGVAKPLRFMDNDNSNFVAFKAAAVVSADVTWTLPAADGSSGQVLQTNGSGVLSWVTQASGANTSLSNLITTSINQSLLPDSDSARDLGSGALKWRRLYADDARDASDVVSVQFVNRNLYDAAGNLTVDWNNTVLKDASAINAFQWGNTARILNDEAGTQAIRFYGSQRELYDIAGAALVNFATAGELKVIGDLSVKTGNDLQLWEGTDTYALGLRASSGMTASYALVMPAADGTSDQVLQTDGSGNLSWVNRTTFYRESFTLSAGDITNGYVTLANTPITNSIIMVVGGLVSRYSADYTMSGAQLNFSAHTPALIAGDIVTVQYAMN